MVSYLLEYTFIHQTNESAIGEVLLIFDFSITNVLTDECN